MKPNNIIKSCLVITLAAIILPSCQKVINIDLNSAAPAIIIEGNISSQPGPYTVSLSKTVNFSDANVFPPFTGAAITINDNAGNSEILSETSPGIYQTNTLQGTVGREYTVSVTAEGNNYQAASILPAPVNIDSLIVKTSTGFGGGPGGGMINKSVTVRFTDPAGIENYYRIIEVINHVQVNTFTITSDKLRDGETIDQRLRGNSDLRLQIGDTVMVKLLSIDKGAYEYFRTFNQSDGGGFNSSSPANPTSNISNGALGYFCAYSVTSKTVTIQ